MTGLTPFRLLLVEDEATDAALFRELLAEVSPTTELHHVQHGQQALDFLLESGQPRPQLIVLDLNMPVMNGHEFIREAKAYTALRWIPVLMLAASERPQDIQQAYDDQVSGYIVKPVTYDDYRRLIQAIEGYWRGTVQVPVIEQVEP